MAEILNTNRLIHRKWQPKMQNQFYVSLHNNQETVTTSVKKFSAPQFQDEDVTIYHVNSYFKVRGRRMWQPISMSLYDPVAPSSTKLLMDWARNAYEGVTGRAGYHDFYKRTLTLSILDPVGAVTTQWIIRGAFVTDFNPGEYDWENSSSPVIMDVTLNYDDAIHNFG